MPTHAECTDWLHEWRSPIDLFDRVDAKRQELEWSQFTKLRKYKKLREAWILSRAGTLLGVDKARIPKDDPPDGQFKCVNGRIIPVEATELLQAGRRRGDEEFSEVRRRGHVELTMAMTCNKKWLVDAISKKLAIEARYEAGTVLLVYHNTSLYNWRPDVIASELEDASSLRGENIVGSIVLYEGQLFGKTTIKRVFGDTAGNP